MTDGKEAQEYHDPGIVLLPGQSLRGMADGRIPLYEKYADLTVACSDEDLESVVRRVIEAL